MLSVNSIARVVVNAVRSLGSVTSFDTGLLLIKDTNHVAARRVAIVTSSAAAIEQLTIWGFASNSEPYKAAQKYFGANPSPSKLILSSYPTTETLVEAVGAVLDQTAGFYGIAVGQTESDARLLALDEFLAGLDSAFMLFAPIIGTASAVVAAGSLLSTLHGRMTKRTVPFYCAEVSDAAALMGTAMGLELSHQNTAFSLCYKEIAGLTPSELTETEATHIKDLAGNVYITRGYTHKILELGTVASGMRFDEVLYLDKIASELQDAAVTLLADNPDKMPQTDESTGAFMTVFSSILMKYTDRGVLASGTWRGAAIGPISAGDSVENGFIMWAESYDAQSDADRAAHKAVPISVGLILAGSIESIVITVNVVV